MDQTEFEGFYRQHRPAVLAYALRRTDRPADAADVAAEVFVVAWRRRSEVPADPHARLWLFGVARHALANHRRGQLRRSRLQSRLLEGVQELAPDPATAAGAAERRTEVLGALRALPENDRELLMLVGWDELTPQQAARVLGVSPALARVRLHRARQRLRKALNPLAQRPHQAGQVQHNGHPPVPAGETP